MSGTAAVTVVERLRSRIDADPVLTGLRRTARLREQLNSNTPSGVDVVACTIARGVCAERTGCVALALPRGDNALSVMLGAYLIGWRARGLFPGSVAISMRGTSLRERARDLSIHTDRYGEAIPVARLAALPVRDGRMRAAAMDLVGSHRRGLAQSDRYLLFQLPHVAPPLAENVVSAAVVETTGSSQEVWARTYERNCAARRRQVWLGELGDPDFERFCSDHSVPLFRFDWNTIKDAIDAFGAGAGAFTTAGLSRRVVAPTPLAICVCRYDAFDDELDNVFSRLYEMHRRGKEAEVPEPVQKGMRLAALLGRLACPTLAYDAQAAFNPFTKTTIQLLDAVENARSSAFPGGWKLAYNSHWASVKGSLRRLCELAAEECPKWWKLIERIDEARGHDEKLRIVCQTKPEAAGLAASLVEGGAISVEELEEHIEIVTFSNRLEYGVEGETTIYLAPPPSWRASIYLSAERGRAEVLCYAPQARTLRNAFDRAWRAAARPADNHAVLDGLRVGGAGGINGHVGEPPALVELESFSFEGAPAAPRLTSELTDPVKAFWEQASELYGEELDVPEARFDDDRAAPTSRSGPLLARRVIFNEGPAVFFSDDSLVDVLLSVGVRTQIRPTPLSKLRRGMRLVVLPGAARGSLLNELMAAWDDRLGPARLAYATLWRDALAVTIERIGASALARRLDVTEATVDNWIAGESWPQQRAWQLEVLRLSGDEPAWENRERIVYYIRRTRGMHRLIGRVLNDAVAETVVEGGQAAVQRLAQIVGREFDDLFAAVQVLTVAEVGDPESVSAGLIGHFLDPDDATVKGVA